MSFEDMAGPSDIEVGTTITRPWPNRFNISEEGLEALVHILRRKRLSELDATRRQLQEALEIPRRTDVVERSVRPGRERFHPRRVAAFVGLAQTFVSDVRVLAPVRREGRSAWMDGKRQDNAVEMDGKLYLTLSAIETLPPGTEVTLRAEGPRRRGSGRGAGGLPAPQRLDPRPLPPVQRPRLCRRRSGSH